jgi:hypothetical protein
VSTLGRAVAQPAVTDAWRRSRAEQAATWRSVLADQTAVEPAALAAGQDLAGQVERVEARIAEQRRPETPVDPGVGNPVRDHLAPLAPELRRQVAAVDRHGQGGVRGDPAVRRSGPPR